MSKFIWFVGSYQQEKYCATPEVAAAQIIKMCPKEVSPCLDEAELTTLVKKTKVNKRGRFADVWFEKFTLHS